MKAITIKQPWAWAITAGIKRVENRGWRTSHRGPLLIHAGATPEKYANAIATFRAAGVELPDDAGCGVILGVVELVAVVSYDSPPLCDDPWQIRHLRQDPWATGPFCWLLSRPVMLAKPVPYRGKMGLFDVADSELPESFVRAYCRA